MNADLNQPAYAIQLIDIFSDGLHVNNITHHVIQQQPATLPNAFTAAINEQSMQRRLQIRNRLKEPMQLVTIINSVAIVLIFWKFFWKASL